MEEAAKHTPGPWTYGVRSDGSVWLSIGDHKTGPHFQADLCAAWEDARLIIAAPGLLEAADRAATVLAQMVTDIECTAQLIEWHSVAVERLSALRAAIAKATGEQQ